MRLGLAVSLAIALCSLPGLQASAATWLTPAQTQRLKAAHPDTVLPGWIPAGFTVSEVNVITETASHIPATDVIFTNHRTHQSFVIDSSTDGIGSMDGDRNFSVKVPAFHKEPWPYFEIDGPHKKVSYVSEWLLFKDVAYRLESGPFMQDDHPDPGIESGEVSRKVFERIFASLHPVHL